MENSILMIYLFLIYKLWLGHNQNAKGLYLLLAKVIQQFKLEQTWLSKVDFFLIKKFKNQQIFDKELNFKIVIWMI